MTKEEIIELIKEAKELGLKSLKIGDILVEFNIEHSNEKVSPTIYKEHLKDEELVAPLSKLDQLTDEEILYWSTSYGQELEHRKKQEHEQNIRKQNEDEYV